MGWWHFWLGWWLELRLPSQPRRPVLQSDKPHCHPGDTTVVLAWTAPKTNGGSAITGYNVYEGTSAGGENYSSPVNGGTLITTTTTTVTGLTNATAYYFTVKATNAVGSSGASNEAWAIPAATVPGAPTHVVAIGETPRPPLHGTRLLTSAARTFPATRSPRST